MRSLLFVPGDDARKIEKALHSGADVLILDLEDSVAADRKADARRISAEAITKLRNQSGRPQLYVRVNSLDTGLTPADLDVVMPAGPDGLVLPKSRSGQDVVELAARVAVREAENALPDGSTRILAIATETAASLFHLGSYAGATRRLSGITWGGEDLSADVGALTNRLESGEYTDPYRLARSLCLFGAAAADVPAIDSVYTQFRDPEGLERECLAGHRDGFTAKMAIHPAQVPIINTVFTPSQEAIERAQRIVTLFQANPGAGVLALDGEMLDRPHLRRAERVIAQARSAGLA